tara:strand:- start:10455 stop:11003 length:549 start_codon:yes stop_codon:yes gene_type:complete
VTGKFCNYFSLFSLKEDFEIEVGELERIRDSMLLEVHPDKFVNSSQIEKSAANKYSTQINAGFDILRDPIRRAIHLCSLLGVDSKVEEFRESDTASLEYQLELRERLDDIEQLEKLSDKQLEHLNNLWSEVMEVKANAMLQIGRIFKTREKKNFDSLLGNQISRLMFATNFLVSIKKAIEKY